jgi:hypothetical protein
MKNLIFFIPALIISLAVNAQEEDSIPKPWIQEGMVGLNFSQVSFRNWSAGGVNSVSYNSFLNYQLTYKKDNLSWENIIGLAYGILDQKDQNSIKSDDKIDFSSKYGRKASEKWFYTGLLGFRTQFAPGYAKPGDEEIISTFLAPAYLVLSIGMDYQPNDKFTFFFSPFTGKTTFVMDQSLSDKGAYGVDPGENMKSEFGGFFKAAFKSEIFENITLQTKLDLFSNYLDKPKNWDVNWDTQILLKINKYISGNIFTQLIYDENILFDVDTTGDGIADKQWPKVQFKQLIGLGFSYKF